MITRKPSLLKTKTAATHVYAIAVKMDEDEVEGWYEEEKQKAIDDYSKELEDGKSKKEALERYEKKILKANEKYNLLMNEKLLKKKGRFDRFMSNMRERWILFKK